MFSTPFSYFYFSFRFEENIFRSLIKRQKNWEEMKLLKWVKDVSEKETPYPMVWWCFVCLLLICITYLINSFNVNICWILFFWMKWLKKKKRWKFPWPNKRGKNIASSFFFAGVSHSINNLNVHLFLFSFIYIVTRSHFIFSRRFSFFFSRRQSFTVLIYFLVIHWRSLLSNVAP